MSEFTEFTLGQETPPALDTEGTELKPKKGDQYRVSFISLHGLKEGSLQFEKDGVPTNPNMTALTSMWGGRGVGKFLVKEPRFASIPGIPANRDGSPAKPQTKAYTTLVLWPLDHKGQIDANRLSNGEFQVKTYGFTKTKLQQLQALVNDYPFSQHDLQISVTNDMHQMTFTPRKESLLKGMMEKKPEVFNEVVRRAQFVEESINSLVNVFTYDELVEKFSQSSSNSVGSPNAPASGFSANFEADDILDDLIK